VILPVNSIFSGPNCGRKFYCGDILGSPQNTLRGRRKLNFLMKFSLNPPLARFEIFPFFAVHFNISLINFIPGGPAGRFVFLLSHHRKAADGTSQGEFHFLEFSECASPRTNGRWRGGVRGVDRLALGLL